MYKFHVFQNYVKTISIEILDIQLFVMYKHLTEIPLKHITVNFVSSTLSFYVCEIVFYLYNS